MSIPSSSPMRLVVMGAAGRMGQSLVRAIAQSRKSVLAGALEREGSPALGQDSGQMAGLMPNNVLIRADLDAVFAEADGVIDFSSPEASVHCAERAARAGIVHVVGTTGMREAESALIQIAAQKIAIVKSGNMSLGVNLLAALVKKAAAALDTGFDIEIVEMHHRLKVDAPSGTALLLGEAAAAGRQIDLESHSARGRDGITGARISGEIGFASLRGGSVVGDHSVIFAGLGERIELRHIAEDRGLFASGALKAALWARGQKPGLYAMADVLGLED
jgi:4-hydroxy-tetrahydrodipicolinate reductase